MINFEATANTIKEGFRNLSLMTMIQLILMIIITILSFIFPSSFRGFSPIMATKDFTGNFKWMFLHYFLHGNIFHLLTNCIAILFFGSSVERRIGSTKYLLFFLLHSFLEPLLLMSLYWLKVYDGKGVVGMSGFIFAIIMIHYYEPGKYTDLVYCCLLNVSIFIFALMLGGSVSLLGHFSGILSGFLFTREFFLLVYG